ncbi:MAG: GlsB/YeaQ/YmgE family stress response membrane protein [Candidatus Melainabacteria bacterium]|nr:GlsB/YeaQ/YmgE family stress response membrane protein [Candidatus Melainabacteria bacterium]
MSIVGFICYLIIAAVCAFIADRLTPGSIPGGFFTAAVVGILGAWVGGALFGSLGPSLAGVALLPCILGSAILVFGLSFLSKSFGKK